jgi:hypothetical protein
MHESQHGGSETRDRGRQRGVEGDLEVRHEEREGSVSVLSDFCWISLLDGLEASDGERLSLKASLRSLSR